MTSKLTAPEHLRGPMTSHTDKAIRDERIEWMKSVYRRYSQQEIADALGISANAVGVQLHRHGIHKSRDISNETMREKSGIRLGYVSEAIPRISQAAYARLLLVAARNNCTVAEALADFFNRAHEGGEQ